MGVKVSGIDVEAFEYTEETASIRTQFDGEKTPASLAVLATLAEIMDTDPVDLSPLYSRIDPDALDAVVQKRNGSDGDIHVTFTYEAHTIEVHSYGVITITPLDDAPAIERSRAVRTDER